MTDLLPFDDDEDDDEIEKEVEINSFNVTMGASICWETFNSFFFDLNRTVRQHDAASCFVERVPFCMESLESVSSR